MVFINLPFNARIGRRRRVSLAGAGERLLGRHDSKPTGTSFGEGRSTGSIASEYIDADQPLGGRKKRALDIAIAGIAMLLLSPLMVVIAVLIKVTMGSPIIYAHPRIGHNGRRFRCFKFRTMVQCPDEVLEQILASDPDAAREWREKQKLRNDPRVTIVGSILRISSLDELPQLINVLRGEMSCVGPRPIVAAELDRYGVDAQEYLRSRPGITGLWQVSGRSDTSYGMRVALDCEYVRSWSIWLDLKILLKTLPAVLRLRQAA